MSKNEIIEKLAQYYGLELNTDEKGRYDISGYDWISGCKLGNGWLSLEEIICALTE